MRKTVIFDRPVRLLNPIWHEPETRSSSVSKLKYKKPMVVLELTPGTEYECKELQALINRGAVIQEEDYTYVCSHGFVPLSEGALVPVSTVSTGLDPEKELH